MTSQTNKSRERAERVEQVRRAFALYHCRCGIGTRDQFERRRPLRGAAGGFPAAGQYRSTVDVSSQLPRAGSPARGPFFYPVPQPVEKGVPWVATVVGVGLTALIAALCLGIAFAPVWVHALILEALR